MPWYFDVSGRAWSLWGHRGSPNPRGCGGAAGALVLRVGDQSVLSAFDDVVGQVPIQRQILGVLFDARPGLAEMLGDPGNMELIDGRLLFRRLRPPIPRRRPQRLVFRIGRRRVAKNGRHRRGIGLSKPSDVLQCVT